MGLAVPVFAVCVCSATIEDAQRLRVFGIQASLADDFGQVRQNQQQGGSKEDESGLTYFRMFEHGYLPFFVIPERQCLRQGLQSFKKYGPSDRLNIRALITYGLEPFNIIQVQ